MPSGDGSLTAMNWRNMKARQSDNLEDELLSACLVQRNQTLVTGTQDGSLLLYRVRLDSLLIVYDDAGG